MDRLGLRRIVYPLAVATMALLALGSTASPPSRAGWHSSGGLERPKPSIPAHETFDGPTPVPTGQSGRGERNVLSVLDIFVLGGAAGAGLLLTLGIFHGLRRSLRGRIASARMRRMHRKASRHGEEGTQDVQ